MIRQSSPFTSVESGCIQIRRIFVITSTCLRLERKTTWLGLGKHHGLDLNNNDTYVSKLTYTWDGVRCQAYEMQAKLDCVHMAPISHCKYTLCYLYAFWVWVGCKEHQCLCITVLCQYCSPLWMLSYFGCERKIVGFFAINYFCIFFQFINLNK